MKKLNYLLLTAFALLISTSFNAQTVDEIIENYIENTGGAENWQKVKSIKMNMSINQMGMDIPIEQYSSAERTYTKSLCKDKKLCRVFLMEKHCGQQISCQ